MANLFKLFHRPGQSQVAVGQARIGISVLGQRESFFTFVGVWLAAIICGAVLILLISVPNILGGPNDRVATAAKATSDRNSSGQIGGKSIDQREAIAKEGYAVFTNSGCVVCHTQGGYGTTGQGPRLILSNNSRDSSFIHKIVRWGNSPMVAYPATATQEQIDNGTVVISDQDLYKIVTYLQYAHDNAAQKPSWVTR